MEEPELRIELTLRLWSAGSQRDFEEYVARLLELLPRHQGRLERRANEVESGPGVPDAVLVLSFPSGTAVDTYLRDPMREDLEDLASTAITRSLITDARSHISEEHDPVDVVTLDFDASEE